MRLSRRALSVLILFLLSAVSATVLLLVSGWFISASAIAGVSAAALTFNYVIPSTSIRLLTFVRILSGYGANYFGHNDLLLRLTRIRSRFYDEVMSSSKTEPVSEQLEILDRHIDAAANRHLAATLPTVTAIIIALAIGAWLWIWQPEFFGIYSGVAVLSAGVFFYFWKRTARAIIEFNKITAQYRFDLLERLKSASLWQLESAYGPESPVQHSWQKYMQTVRNNEFRLEWGLQALAATALMLCLWLLPERYLGNALLITLPLILLSLPEWLGPLFRSQRAVAEAQWGQQQIQSLFKNEELLLRVREAGSDVETPQHVKTHDAMLLNLNTFCWLRENLEGEPLTATFKKGELIGIQGDSGGGKTSFLMALSGLLQSRGSLSLITNNQHVVKMADCHGSMHYCEQNPYVLSDTLRNNLLIARPDATDEQLQQALTFACLEQRVNALDQWLGEQGRVLSGGERKRLGLARAWLAQRSIWLLDEPFEGLDSELQRRLCTNIKSVLSHHMVLLVSHRAVPDLNYDQVVTFSSPQITRSTTNPMANPNSIKSE